MKNKSLLIGFLIMLITMLLAIGGASCLAASQLLSDVVEVGDYVNYPVGYENVASLTNTSGVSNYVSSYQGWRVISKDADGTVNLISAGIPLTFYNFSHYEITVPALTTDFLTTPFSTGEESATYRKNGFSEYSTLEKVFTNEYTAVDVNTNLPKVRSINQEDVFSVTGLSKMSSEMVLDAEEYDGLFKNGGWYWIASLNPDNTFNYSMWHVMSIGVASDGFPVAYELGVRPVVSLKSTVTTIGKDKNGVWDITTIQGEPILLEETYDSAYKDGYILGNSTIGIVKSQVNEITVETSIPTNMSNYTNWDVSKNSDRSVMAYLVPNGTLSGIQMYHLHIAGNDGKVIATEGRYLFANYTNCTAINGLDKLNTSNVTSMVSMFNSCRSLTSLDVSSFDTSNVTDMSGIFNYCNNLTTLDLSKFNTSNVTSMSSMFYECQSLTKLDLSSFDTRNVNVMVGMFYGCQSLTKLDLSSFDTSNVTDMTGMFHSCGSLINLNLSNFDTSEVKYMTHMFVNCSSLTSLDVSNFDTSNVADMWSMFFNCTSLTTLKLGQNFTKLNGTSMFSNTPKLTAIISEATTPLTITDVNGKVVDNGLKTSNIAAVIYVPNATVETAYEQNTNYKSLFANFFTNGKTARIEPILGLYGDKTLTLKVSDSYTEAAKVAGYQSTTGADITPTEIKSYGYVLTQTSNNTSLTTPGNYTVTYKLTLNGNTVDEITRTVTIEKKTSTITVSNASVKVGQTIVVTYQYDGDGIVTATSGATGTATVGTVNTTNKTVPVTGVANGNTVIILAAAEGNEYKAATKYFEVTVVDDDISITTHSTDKAVKEGTAVTFTVVASGTNLKYQWYKAASNTASGTAISGATTATYTIPAASVTKDLNGTYYYCSVTNATGTINSNRALLTVYYAPTIKTQPESQIVSALQPATFSVAATAGNPNATTYKWQYRTSSSGTWTDISGAASARYTISSATPAMSGYQYRVLLGNSQYANAVASSAATLTVNKIELVMPTVSGTYTYNGTSQTVKIGGFDSAIMTVSNNTRTDAGTQLVTVSLKDTSNYQWSDGTTTEKSVSWTIEKATPTLSISDVSLKANEEVQVSYTYTGDSTSSVNAATNNGNIAIVSSINSTNKTITIRGVASGTTTMTIDIAEGTNYSAATTSSQVIVTEADNISVAIDQNGGTYEGSTNITVITKSDEATISIPNPVKTGHKFTGWTLTGGGTLNEIAMYGYGNANNATLSTNGGGNLVVTALNGDPNFSLATDFSASEIKKIRVTMDNAASTVSQVFFAPVGGSISETNSVKVTTRSGVANQVLTFDFSSNANWSGVIETIRFDPGSAAGTYVIKKIEYLGASNNVVLTHDNFAEKVITYTFGTTSGILTANWGESLTVNPNDGITDTRLMSDSKGVTVSVPMPIRAGYKFKGWTLSGGGTLNEVGMYGYGNVTNGTLSVNAAGNLVVTATNLDPSFRLATNFSASQIKKIRVTIDNAKSNNIIQVFFAPVGGSISETNSVIKPLISGNANQVVTFDFASNANWSGVIETLRFDPGSEVGTYVIKKIEFLDAKDAVILTHDNFTEKGYTYTFGDEAGILTASWVDEIGPTIGVSNINYGQSATITLSDEVSGLAGYNVTVANSQPSTWLTAASSQAYKPLTAGTYYVWAKDTEGNISSKSFTVNKVSPILSASNVSLKVGNTITINHGYDGDGEVSASLNSTSIAKINSVDNTTLVIEGISGGNAEVTLTASAGTNYASKTIIFTVMVEDINAEITTQPINKIVNENTAVSFTVAASGTNLSYQWYKASSSTASGTTISGATSATYSIPASSVTKDLNGAHYYCKVSNSSGSVESTRAQLTVYYKPIITSHPVSQTVTLLNSSTFSVVVSDGNPSETTYQWQQSTDNGNTWTNILEATRASYTIANTIYEMNGNQYRVLVGNSQYPVSNASQAIVSNAATLTINKFTPSIIASDVVVEVGETVTITYEYDGDGEVRTTTSAADILMIEDMDIINKTITIKCIAEGEVTIELTAAETTNYLAANATFKVTAKKITLEKPTISGTYTYNGSVQTVELDGFDSATMTVSDNTRTDAGTQSVVVSLKDKTKYKWSDGTIDDLLIEWTIDKKEATLIVDASSVSVICGNDTTITVTYDGDGEVEVTSKDTAIATATLASNVITIKGENAGTTTIEVNAAVGANYASASMTISVIVKQKVEPILMREAYESINKTLLGYDRYTGDFDLASVKRENILTISILDTSVNPIPTDAVASWDVSRDNNGSVTTWLVQDTTDTTMYHMYIGGNGGVIASSAVYLFDNYTNCTNINNLNLLDVSKITSMNYMFSACKSLISLDLNSFDTANVTSLVDTFSGCSSLTTLNISNWNTSKVTQMSGTFYNCSSLTSLDVKEWDVSNVKTTLYLFAEMTRLTSLDISKWQTNSAETLECTFYKCTALTSLDVSNWNISKATNIGYMFYNCSSLTTLDLNKWDTSSVTEMDNMFENCTNLETIDLNNWNLISVEDMDSVFKNCSNLKSVKISNWNTSKVDDMSYLFDGCSNLTSLDLTNWDTNKVTNMTNMFANCGVMKSVLIGNKFNKLNGATMFTNDTALTSIITTKSITSSGNAMELSTTTGLKDLPNAILYVPNIDSEVAYEEAENYSTVFAHSGDVEGDMYRIRPILELAGNNPIEVEIKAVYDATIDEGVKVAGFDKNASGDYMQYGYEVEVSGLPVDTKTLGEKEVIYTLKYTSPSQPSDDSVKAETVMTVRRIINVNTNDTTLPQITLKSIENLSLATNKFAKEGDTIRIVIEVEEDAYADTTLKPEDIIFYVADQEVSLSRKEIESITEKETGADICILVSGLIGDGEISFKIPAEKFTDITGNANIETIINTGMTVDNTVSEIIILKKVQGLDILANLKDSGSGIRYFGLTEASQASEPSNLEEVDVTKGSVLDTWYRVKNSIEISDAESDAADIIVSFAQVSEGKYKFWAKDLAGNVSSVEFESKRIDMKVNVSSIITQEKYEQSDIIDVTLTTNIDTFDVIAEGVMSLNAKLVLRNADRENVPIPQGTKMFVDGVEATDGFVVKSNLDGTTFTQTNNIKIDMTNVYLANYLKTGNYIMEIQYYVAENGIFTELVSLYDVDFEVHKYGYYSLVARVETQGNQTAKDVLILTQGTAAERVITLEYKGDLIEPYVDIKLRKQTGNTSAVGVNEYETLENTVTGEHYDLLQATQEIRANFVETLNAGEYELLFELYDKYSSHKASESIRFRVN